MVITVILIALAITFVMTSRNARRMKEYNDEIYRRHLRQIRSMSKTTDT